MRTILILMAASAAADAAARPAPGTPLGTSHTAMAAALKPRGYGPQGFEQEDD